MKQKHILWMAIEKFDLTISLLLRMPKVGGSVGISGQFSPRSSVQCLENCLNTALQKALLRFRIIYKKKD